MLKTQIQLAVSNWQIIQVTNACRITQLILKYFYKEFATGSVLLASQSY